MAKHFPRRPPGVTRMLRAQAAKAPRPPSLTALIAEDRSTELVLQIQSLLDTGDQNQIERFLSTTHGALIRAALAAKKGTCFDVLVTMLHHQGKPVPPPPQVLSWALKACPSPETFLDDARCQFDWICRNTPQTLGAADWLQLALRGMKPTSTTDMEGLEWYKAEKKRFLAQPSHQKALFEQLLDVKPEASTLLVHHTGLKKLLQGLSEEEAEQAGQRLATLLKKRLDGGVSPLQARGLGQWFIQLRNMGLAQAHPVQAQWVNHLCTHHDIPSNASHQQGPWGLLYRLYAGNSLAPAPLGLSQAWTPEAAEAMGASLGKTLSRYVAHDLTLFEAHSARHGLAFHDLITETRWNVSIDALVLEACFLEKALHAWGVGTADTDRAFEKGIMRHVPAFQDLMDQVKLSSCEYTIDAYQGWRQRHKALVLQDMLPPSVPRKAGPRF